MKNIHWIFLSIPSSFILYYLILGINIMDVFKNEYIFFILGNILVTIPFFYIFVLKFYHKPGINGVIIIQLEIFFHFLYTMGILLYIHYQKLDSYTPIFIFFIFLLCYYIFKLAILMTIKK